MNGFLKFALGVAVLGVVGLVGLSVMSIVATLLFSRSASQKSLPVNQETAEMEYVEAPAWAGPDDSTPASHWGQLAQAQVNVHDTWMDGAESFVGVILLFGMPAILFIVIRSMRRGRSATPSDESALVHELARRAQDLSDRMEALETILLDRTRATR